MAAHAARRGAAAVFSCCVGAFWWQLPALQKLRVSPLNGWRQGCSIASRAARAAAAAWTPPPSGFTCMHALRNPAFSTPRKIIRGHITYQATSTGERQSRAMAKRKAPPAEAAPAPAKAARKEAGGKRRAPQDDEGPSTSGGGAVAAAHTVSGFKNKEKVLLLSSRGITYR